MPDVEAADRVLAGQDTSAFAGRATLPLQGVSARGAPPPTSQKMNEKTAADLLFEEYLTTAGLPFRYEEPLRETTKVPDYQVEWRSRVHLFEVKGFDPEVKAGEGFGTFDPYPPIRKKITKAVEKFKDLEAYPCSLVLHNASPGLILLEPFIVLGAMLGDVAFQIPVHPDGRGLDDKKITNVFTKGGKMLKYGKGAKPFAPENTTINAIIVVAHYAVGQKRFFQHVEALQKSGGRKLTDEEFWAEMERCQGTDRDVSLSVVRCRIHENPCARMPLPRDLFCGPYDERFGSDGEGHIVRLFAGAEIATFEN